MRAPVFGFKPVTRMDWAERTTDLTLNLRSLFTVVIIKIFRRSRTYSTDRVFRDFSSRIPGINRF